MRKNKSYWERRAEARINRYTEDAEKTADLIGKAYFQAERYFEEEAKKVFQGFQNAFELSEREAKRLLNVKPDEKAMDSLRKALEKITDPEERNNVLAALSSPAYQYRINRLDKLNEEIAKTCNELYKTELKIDRRFLAAETDKAYKSMMFDIQKGTGISGAFDMLPKSYINQVLNTNWSGEHFSERIWGNTTKLATDLKQDLLVGMLTGQSERDMAASIMERTGTSSFNARRLVRTETTYVTNQAELKSYEEAEIDEYEYSACIDGRTSELCRELDGKTFKVKDGKPGKNLPPMHPFCRSTTLAVLPSEEELDKAFEDFKADNIPEGMDFDEWLDGLEPTEDGKLVFRDKIAVPNPTEGNSQFYKPVITDNNDVIGLKRTKNSETVDISAKRLIGRNNAVYISDNATIKPKLLHEIDTNATEVFKLLGVSDDKNLPKICIISSKEMLSNAPAAYNAIDNIIYFNEKYDSLVFSEAFRAQMACADNPLSTMLHETLHWKDAQDYIKKFGKVESLADLNKYENDLFKKKLDELTEKGYNIYDISDYATNMIPPLNEKYYEAYTEYRVLQILSR